MTARVEFCSNYKKRLYFQGQWKWNGSSSKLKQKLLENEVFDSSASLPYKEEALKLARVNKGCISLDS